MPAHKENKVYNETIVVNDVYLKDNTTPAYYLILDSDSNAVPLTADRTLIFDVNNADRTIDLAGDLALTGDNTVALWRVNGTLTLESAATITNTSAGDVELTADNTSTSGRNAWQVDARVSGACTGSSRAGYFHITNTNGTGISGELTGLEAKVRSTSSDTASAKGIHVSLDAKTKTITLGRGLEISLDASAGGGITTAQGLRIAHNSSGSHTAITGAIIEGPGTWTKGIDFAGTFDKPIDMSGMTCGSNLWTLFHGTVSSATSIKGIYLEVTSTKTSSSTEGIRAEGIGNAASGTATIRGGHFKANILASKKATMLEGVLAHASVAAGGISGITTVKGLGAFVSSGATFSTTNLYGATILVQTRGDETVSGNYVGLQIQNEAVGGNGKEMDSAIQIVDTNVTANGFGYGIDMSGAVIGTADIILQNSETIKNTTDGIVAISGITQVTSLQASGAALLLQDDAAQNITMFGSAGAGKNPVLNIVGDASGSPITGTIQIDSSGDFVVKAVTGKDMVLGNADGTIIEFSSVRARLKDDAFFAFGTDNDATIQYDEIGDNTLQLSLPVGGMSMRTAVDDVDNAGLIKVSKTVITAADLTASAATDNENLLNQPAGSVLLSAKFVLDTQFSGGSVSDVDLEVGLSGDENGLIAAAAHNLYSDTVGTEYTTRGAYWSATTAAGYHAATATQWIAYFTAVGDTWDNITGGQITAYFMYIDFQGT